MANDISPQHQKQLEDATAALAVAQTEVEAALKEITSNAARADKSIISHRLAVAFENLTTARTQLDAVVADNKK